MEHFSRFVLSHRRALVAIFSGIAVWSVVTAMTAEPDRVSVLVAARDLPSGSEIRTPDLMEVGLPEEAVPDKVVTREHLRSRVVAGPMRRGEPFTDRRVIDPRDLGEGEQLATLEIPRATAALVRVGDIVDVVSVDPATSDEMSTVARRTRVITVSAAGDHGSAGIAVAARPEVARAIAQATVRSVLTVLPVAIP